MINDFGGIRMKEKLKKIYEWTYFPFLILFIFILFFTFFINFSNYGDDSWFVENSSNKSNFEFVSWRYENWTSRVIIEFVLISLLKMGNTVCRIFISIMFVALGVAISKTFIINKTDKEKVRAINWIIVFLLFTIEYSILIGAGVMATIVNYLFPVTLGIFVIYYIRKAILKENIKKFEYPLYLILTIISTNMEQMSAILFVVCLISLIYFIIKEKKLNIFLLVLFIISALSLVNVLVCPGNAVRNESETETWFPEYANFGIIEKTKCGIYLLISSCFGSLNIPYIIFSIIVMIEIIKKYKNFIIRTISIIPVIAGTAFTVFSPITANIFPVLYTVNDVIMNGFNAMETRLIWLLVYSMILVCLLISVVLVFKKNWKTFILILVLGAGFASKFIMGFSPTVFASGTRTTFIMICSFIISIILILEKENKTYINNILSFIIIFAMLQSLNNVFALIDVGILF